MATIDLGRLGFVNKGTYNNSTTYEKNDLVQFTDGGILSTYLYIDSTAQSGQAPSSSGTVGSRWVYFAKGGAAGTDVGTTLTTQGDILYRDGSGLQRLAAGTSGQVLQTGGSGANPSWGTVSSDFVKLASASDINTTSYNVDGFFSSTYTNYMLVFSTVRTSSNSSIYVRVNHSGNQYSGSAYKFAVGQAYRDSSGSSWSGSANSWSASEFRVNADDHGNSKSGSLIITINDPLTTNGQRHITSDFNYMRGTDGATHQRVYGGCTVDNTTAATGLRVFAGSGNFKADHFAMYGMKA